MADHMTVIMAFMKNQTNAKKDLSFYKISPLYIKYLLEFTLKFINNK